MPTDNTNISDILCSSRNPECFKFTNSKAMNVVSLALGLHISGTSLDVCFVLWRQISSPLILTKQAMNVYVTFWRVRVTTVAVVNTKYYILWKCICSLTYPACNARVPYCYLCPARSTIFSTLSHRRHDFFKNVTEKEMCVVIFYTAFFLEHFSFKEEFSEI